MNFTRRRLVMTILGVGAVGAAVMTVPKKQIKKLLLKIETTLSPPKKNITDEISDVFLAKNGTPQQNVTKVIEMMGGIEKFIGTDDIVILKPNAQWWNQGRTNLAAMKGFIDLVLQMPGFKGEIIIAENHHFMDESSPDPDNIRGWVEFSEINGDIDGVNHNLNTLVELFQNQGHANVTKAHWRDGGPKAPEWGNGQNGGVVKSPADGDGYLWTDEDYIFEGFMGLQKSLVKMSYPVFTSTYSGITVDFKNGPYQRDGRGGGQFLVGKHLKFINFSAINAHDNTGITASIKNYMGITDMSCGWWGLQPDGYRNIHDCGGSRDYPHAKAGPLGYFMRTIRKADLNIITADWVGWGHRTDVSRATRMKTILAGTDPMALDYYGAKHLIYPLSHQQKLHDPDNTESTIFKFLTLAQKVYGGGALVDEQINLQQYDFNG